MPTLTFKTKDEIPESLREFAQETDGGFKVGVVHESFRDRNIKLAQERDSLASVFGKVKEVVGHEDIDKFASEFAELRTTAQLVKDGKLTKKEEIEAEVGRRLAAQREALDEQIKANARRAQEAEEKAGGYASKWKQTLLDTAVTEAVLTGDSGANPAALPDILSRARSIFKVREDGSLVAMKGDTVLYSEVDGETPMKPTEWLMKLLKDAPYLGKGSAGGGATGNTKGVGGTGLSEDQMSKLDPAERLTRFRQAQGRK
ncbi:MAG: hypothetical protein ACXW13_00005 [Burkholderiaceae bacterium]